MAAGSTISTPSERGPPLSSKPRPSFPTFSWVTTAWSRHLLLPTSDDAWASTARPQAGPESLSTNTTSPPNQQAYIIEDDEIRRKTPLAERRGSRSVSGPPLGSAMIARYLFPAIQQHHGSKSLRFTFCCNAVRSIRRQVDFPLLGTVWILRRVSFFVTGSIALAKGLWLRPLALGHGARARNV